MLLFNTHHHTSLPPFTVASHTHTHTHTHTLGLSHTTPLSPGTDSLCGSGQCEWAEAGGGGATLRADSTHGGALGAHTDHTALDHKVSYVGYVPTSLMLLIGMYA